MYTIFIIYENSKTVGLHKLPLNTSRICLKRSDKYVALLNSISTIHGKL